MSEETKDTEAKPEETTATEATAETKATEMPEAKEKTEATTEAKPEAQAEEKPAAEKTEESPKSEEPKDSTPKSADEKLAGDKPEEVAGAKDDKDKKGGYRSDRRAPRKTTFRRNDVVDPNEEAPDFFEKVVFINRCAKVVKGGRRFSFSALVVTGDMKGKVGFGFGKANEVSECIRKATENAKKQMIKVDLNENTIPHEVLGIHGGGKVLLRPASPGTGIIAGGSVRAVLEAVGIKDILTKSLGSNNHGNVVKATLEGLASLRTRENIYKLRGKKIAEKKAI